MILLAAIVGIAVIGLGAHLARYGTVAGFGEGRILSDHYGNYDTGRAAKIVGSMYIVIGVLYIGVGILVLGGVASQTTMTCERRGPRSAPCTESHTKAGEPVIALDRAPRSPSSE